MRGALRAALLAGLVALLPAGAARAVDGVTEINQAAALAGGVSGTDTAGFPVTLDAPGSYRLTGDLAVATSGPAAVEIVAEDVTLDLNGFTIEAVSDGIWIRGTGENAAVRNGTVRGADDGIRSDAELTRLQGVRLLGNLIGFDPVLIPSLSMVRSCVLSGNTDYGVFGMGGGLMLDSEISDNTTSGLVYSDLLIGGNVVRGNGGDGLLSLSSSSNGLIVGNTVTGNGLCGIFAGDGDGYAENTVSGNTSGSVDAGVPLGTTSNVCDGSTTCTCP